MIPDQAFTSNCPSLRRERPAPRLRLPVPSSPSTGRKRKRPGNEDEEEQADAQSECSDYFVMSANRLLDSSMIRELSESRMMSPQSPSHDSHRRPRSVETSLGDDRQESVGTPVSWRTDGDRTVEFSRASLPIRSHPEDSNGDDASSDVADSGDPDVDMDQTDPHSHIGPGTDLQVTSANCETGHLSGPTTVSWESLGARQQALDLINVQFGIPPSSSSIHPKVDLNTDRFGEIIPPSAFDIVADFDKMGVDEIDLDSE